MYWSQKDLISILVPLLTVTLGTALNVFEPHISPKWVQCQHISVVVMIVIMCTKCLGLGYIVKTERKGILLLSYHLL